MDDLGDGKNEKEVSVAEEGHTLEDITVSALPEDTVDPVYAAKAHVLNNAIQGMILQVGLRSR